jgi:hypothetical protein
VRTAVRVSPRDAAPTLSKATGDGTGAGGAFRRVTTGHLFARNPAMMRLATLAAALIATSLPFAAQAQVSYALTGTFGADTDGDGTNETYDWLFSFSTPSYVASLTEVTPTACSITGSFYACAATQTIDPMAATFGPPIDDAFVGFNVANIGGGGGGTSFYFFQGGAFAANGVYTTTGQPNPSGPLYDDNGAYSVGNAGLATLTVTGIPTSGSVVPEPASWAMMIAGVAGIGGALRRRRPPRKNAIA